jgi:hypothetical protein
MKSIYILLTIVTGILFFACNKEDVPDDFVFGIEKSCKINGEYQSDDQSLRFKLTEINDSRCPSDVVCVWEGMVEIKIAVEKPVSGTIELNTHFHTIDTLANYSFEVMEVTPYPISTQTIDLEDYIVKLKIKNL